MLPQVCSQCALVEWTPPAQRLPYTTVCTSALSRRIHGDGADPALSQSQQERRVTSSVGKGTGALVPRRQRHQGEMTLYRYCANAVCFYSKPIFNLHNICSFYSCLLPAARGSHTAHRSCRCSTTATSCSQWVHAAAASCCLTLIYCNSKNW